MYSYYLCVPLSRALNKNESKSLLVSIARVAVNNFIKVKKFITMMQLLQFVIIFSRDLYILFNVYVRNQTYFFPTFMVWTECIYMVTMVVLFMNFYINSYGKKEKSN